MHIAPPPICQALFLSFQVSLPGSPGAGITYLRHSSLPVLASSDAIQSRTPRSPAAGPAVVLSFTGGGRAGDDLVLHGERRGGELQVILAVGDVGLPFDLAGLLVGGDDARREVRG